MNTISESRADAAAVEPDNSNILVWDLPVRVFHWLMVLCFAGAYLTAESERWRLLHTTLGYTMAGLVGFRILWGLVGTRHARFASFVRGPKAAGRYLGSMLRGQPEHYTGHNPAGALAIVGLILLAITVAVSGWATYNEVGGEWLEEVHEVAANGMLALVGLHVLGVVVGSLVHRENLVRAMVTGRKAGTPDQGIRRGWSIVAILILAAVLGFWWLQWQSAPTGDLSGGAAIAQEKGSHRDDDD